MSKDVKITCDQCRRDLTDSGAMPAYRLALTPERIAQSGGIGYAVHVYPPIDGQHHFCSLECLGAWIKDIASPTYQYQGKPEQVVVVTNTRPDGEEWPGDMPPLDEHP